MSSAAHAEKDTFLRSERLTIEKKGEQLFQEELVRIHLEFVACGYLFSVALMTVV